MKLLRYSSILSLFLFSLGALFAQEDFHHPELEWRSIETEHFFGHYHQGTERTARVVAKVADERCVVFLR